MVKQYDDFYTSMKEEVLETINRLREFIVHLLSQKVGGLKNSQKLFKVSTINTSSESVVVKEIERLTLKLDTINKLDR